MNYLSPLFNSPVLNTDVTFLTGGKLYTYEAGTSTPLATYTTQNGSTPHDNPIILNARGLPNNGNPIWLASGREYKFILKDSNDNTIAPTYDDVGGLNDATLEQSEWQTSTFAPTYISATSFSVTGDRTATLSVGRRLKTTNTGGAVYSTISTSSFGAGVTTVVVTNDSGTLDSGISAVAYGLLDSANSSLPNSSAVRQTMGFGYGADIASAATLDLTNADGQIKRVTGTVAVSSVTLANGQTAVLFPTAALPLTYNATTNPLQGGVSYTCSAGDALIYWKDNSGVLHNQIIKVDGKALATTPLGGYLFGLGMSTAGSSTTLTVASGAATDSTKTTLMNLASSMAKTTSAWAAGTGNGGKLSAAAIANSTWYYWYLLYNPSTGAVDVGFDVSATSPTLPSGYTQFRYIGAAFTNGSAQWTKFVQDGDLFKWDAPPLDVNITTGGVNAVLRTVSVPLSRRVQAIMNVVIGAGTVSGEAVYISDPSVSDQAPSSSAAPLCQIVTLTSGTVMANQITCYTNTSSQVRTRLANGSASDSFRISAIGWIDTRGKDA